MAASLVGITATSTAAAAVYLDHGRVDVPLALRLEVAAVIGAVGAGLAASLVPEAALYLAFTVVLLYSAASMLRGEGGGGGAGADRGGDGGVPAGGRPEHMPTGVAASGAAGVASALLGIGGGLLKVPIMHQIMKVPLQVVTATSAFMVGMTAAASGWIYWLRGDLLLSVAGPVALGVLAGSGLGSRVSGRIPDRFLRVALAAVFVYMAVRMGWSGWGMVAS